MKRQPSFEHFWPFYIGEHRHPRCRALHFVGTTGFFLCAVACFVTEPLRFGAAVAVAAVLAILGNELESSRNTAALLIGMVLIAAYAHPALLIGVVFAYACSWTGHFKVEKNRPATFTYPLWSLRGDLRMWRLMASGQLWSGDVDGVAKHPR